MTIGLRKIRVVSCALVACCVLLLFAEPASAVSPRVSSYIRGCIEFQPGSSKLTNEGLATLDNMINVFSGSHLHAVISIDAPYLGDRVDPSDDEFRKGVSGWLDLSHARTKEVINRILANSDTVTGITVGQFPHDHCPMLNLHVDLPKGLPDLNCDKAACQPDK